MDDCCIGYGERVPETRKPRRSPTPGERQRDPERTKARILEAAKAEFGAKGFAAARVGDIADAAGVNKQLISYYFGGKEGLYEELTSANMQRLVSLSDPEQPLDEVVREFVKTSVTDPDMARIFLWENFSDDGANDTEGAEGQQDFMRGQVEYVRARQAAGDLPDDLDPGQLLLILISAASAPLAFRQVAKAISGQDPTSESFIDAYAEQLSRLLRHLRH
jgi:TetR/AcrR family transcriptional regulator